MKTVAAKKAAHLAEDAGAVEEVDITLPVYGPAAVLSKPARAIATTTTEVACVPASVACTPAVSTSGAATSVVNFLAIRFRRAADAADAADGQVLRYVQSCGSANVASTLLFRTAALVCATRTAAFTKNPAPPASTATTQAISRAITLPSPVELEESEERAVAVAENADVEEVELLEVVGAEREATPSQPRQPRRAGYDRLVRFLVGGTKVVLLAAPALGLVARVLVKAIARRSSR